MAQIVRTVDGTPNPNYHKVNYVRLHGTPQAVTNVGVGTKFLYEKPEKKDCLKDNFVSGSILSIQMKHHTCG